MRRDFRTILLNFRRFEKINFGITTNGLLLHRYFDDLVDSGFLNINILELKIGQILLDFDP